MRDSGLIFRSARADDLDMIWNLLHAVSISWNDERIIANLDGMYLLFQDKKLLGVLKVDQSTKGKVLWSAVHPIYPEKQINTLMMECLGSLQYIARRRVTPGLLQLEESPY